MMSTLLEKFYQCPFCQKSFRRYRQRQWCLEDHGFDQCFKCFKLLGIKDNRTLASNLKAHFNAEKETHATEAGTTDTACPICDEVIAFSNLVLHIECMHLFKGARLPSTRITRQPKPKSRQHWKKEICSAVGLRNSAVSALPAPDLSSKGRKNENLSTPGPNGPSQNQNQADFDSCTCNNEDRIGKASQKQRLPLPLFVPVLRTPAPIIVPRSILKQPTQPSSASTSIQPRKSVKISSWVRFKMIERDSDDADRVRDGPLRRARPTTYRDSLSAGLDKKSYPIGRTGLVCWL